MNVDSLSAVAEKIIQKKAGSLKDFRETHLSLFKQKGFECGHEDYKFTPLERFFDTLDLTGVEKQESFEHYLNSPLPTMLFVNGILQNPLQLPDVKVTSLQENLSRLSDLFKKKNALGHLHHALLTDGVFIQVNKKAENVVIRLLFIHSKPGLTAPTIYFEAGAFSQTTLLVETMVIGNAGHAQISETYVQLNESSSVEHVQIVRGHEGSIYHGATYVEVAKDAQYKNVLFHVSGKLNRSNLELNLKAPGANGESYNLFLTGKTEHSDINTVIHHEAPDSTSTQIAKGILDGESKGIFTGLIHIHPQAQRVASSQLNKNLLLSKKAQIHSQPQLEIFADDVKCSHGSTTGQLSDDEVFYFQARGIPADKARTLLAHGFGLEIVQKIKQKDVQNLAGELIMDTLKTKFQLGGEDESVKK